MSATPSFTYTPLKRPSGQEIRVITLERGSKDDPIRCKLVNVDFTQRYEAVSYEWGPRGGYERIFVNDVPFVVRKNLYDALRHFRRTLWDRVLWVDALCINQDDIPEKNKQLRMMGTIFSLAWDTLVWLGLAGDDSDLAISHLKLIGHNGLDASLAIIGNQDRPYEREMRAIAAFCNRTYWQRIWVVQEIRLARQITICCGDKTIAGETFLLAGKIIEDAFNPKILSLLQNIGDSLASKLVDHTQYQDMRLKDWLITTRDSLSSDPKDKVYALTNLATDCRSSSKLRIDCSKEVSVSQVYKDVLRVCCVDPVTQRPVYDVFDLSQELQRALNSPSKSVQMTEKDNELVWVCGVFAARITSFQSDQRVAWSHELYPKNISEGEETTWSTKLSNCVLNPDAGRHMEIIRKRRFSDPKAPVQIVNNIVIAASPQILDIDDALMELQAVCRKLKLKDSQHRGKPFLCNGREYSGFAPVDAEIGDKICLFPGSRIGLVFRQLLDRDDSWWLVGRSIMDKRFKRSEEDVRNFWRGDPQHPASVSFGCDDACYLRLNMFTLQRLTAD